MIQEHSITLNLELPAKDVDRKMPIFYNSIMKSNRNIAILLLNSIPQTNLKISDPLAGSGIRALRFLKELKKGKIKEITVNDYKENFPKLFNNLLKLNKIEKDKKIIIKNQEANLFLLQQTGFDYIDIDPFGSPNNFLAAAIARIARGGILAITATDTAALTGTYLKVTKRKYWATSLKNYLMHETGLRILIRKIQLQGMQFDKALIPLLAYHKDHYFRIYFISNKRKEKCDEIIKKHQYFLYCSNCLSYKMSIYNKERCSCKQEFQFAGPLWTGYLHDKTMINTMVKNNHFSEEQKFLNILKEESKINNVGYYDLHIIAKKLKIEPPKMGNLFKKIAAVRTHFSPTGIKTDLPIEKLIKEIK